MAGGGHIHNKEYLVYSFLLFGIFCYSEGFFLNCCFIWFPEEDL